MATRTVTRDFAVLRYNDDVPLHLRKHAATVGRYSHYVDAELARLDLYNSLDLHVEERSESWEEEVDEDGEHDQDTEAGTLSDES